MNLFFCFLMLTHMHTHTHAHIHTHTHMHTQNFDSESEKNNLPAPQMSTLLPRPTLPRLQAWTPTDSGSNNAPSSKLTWSGNLATQATVAPLCYILFVWSQSISRIQSRLHLVKAHINWKPRNSLISHEPSTQHTLEPEKLSVTSTLCDMSGFSLS